MGLFKATIRFLAKSTNDSYTKYQKKKNKKLAFQITGKVLKKSNTKVNAKQIYHNKLKTLNEKTSTKSKRREEFINDFID